MMMIAILRIGWCQEFTLTSSPNEEIRTLSHAHHLELKKCFFSTETNLLTSFFASVIWIFSGIQFTNHFIKF